MKHLPALTLLALLTLTATGCLRSGIATIERKTTQFTHNVTTHSKDRVTRLSARHRSFQSLKQTGGLQVGDPILMENGWFLPIHVSTDASQRAIVEHNEPQYQEVIYGIKHDMTKHNHIRFWVQTGMPSSKQESQYSNGIFLGNMQPGQYLLQYKNPDHSRIDLAVLEFENTTTALSQAAPADNQQANTSQ